MTTRRDLPDIIHAEAMIEATDVSGTRTFALKVQEDSMEPMFTITSVAPSQGNRNPIHAPSAKPEVRRPSVNETERGTRQSGSAEKKSLSIECMFLIYASVYSKAVEKGK
jgi:hypothetical protein